jgi:hypothetical protein
MRSTVLFVLIPAIVVALVASDRGAAATPPNAIRADSVAVAKVVTDFHEALAKGDSGAALSFFADDAIILESGAVERRSEYRLHHLPADIEFAAFSVQSAWIDPVWVAKAAGTSRFGFRFASAVIRTALHSLHDRLRYQTV